MMGRSLNSMGNLTDKVVDPWTLKSYENEYRTTMLAAYNPRRKAQTRGTVLVGESVKVHTLEGNLVEQR